jgi:hypothetical protein
VKVGHLSLSFLSTPIPKLQYTVDATLIRCNRASCLYAVMQEPIPIAKGSGRQKSADLKGPGFNPAAEEPIRGSKKCQGTTSVVPQSHAIESGSNRGRNLSASRINLAAAKSLSNWKRIQIDEKPSFAFSGGSVRLQPHELGPSIQEGFCPRFFNSHQLDFVSKQPFPIGKGRLGFNG